MSMAIIAGGDFRSDVGFPKGHGFSVVGIAVMRQPIFVAMSAAPVASSFEVIRGGTLDLMSRVTVCAHWRSGISFSQQPAVHAPVVRLFDFDMTLAASLGYRGLIDR